MLDGNCLFSRFPHSYGDHDFRNQVFLKDVGSMNVKMGCVKLKYNDMVNGFSYHKLMYDLKGEPIDIIFIEINDVLENIIGLKRENIVGKSIMEMILDNDISWIEKYNEVALTGRSNKFACYAKNLDKWFEISMFLSKKGYCALIWNDITQHKLYEKEIFRLNGLFEVLSNMNSMLLNTKSSEELFYKTCEIIAKHKEFMLVWIGLNDPKTFTVIPFTYAGENLDYVQNIVIFSDERLEGLGPTGTSIREARTVVCNDFFASKFTLPWQSAAKISNIKASAVVPFNFYGKAYGALAIYSTKTNFFQEREIQLMEKIAAGITYGLEHLDKEMKRKQAEERNLYLSYHDSLTGLYNRRFYEEEIKRLDTERNLPISIIIGDVNGLKLVNDAFGHDKGDELLQKAAASILSACRTDDIVARWGGDEFLLLLPKTKTEEAENIVNRIKELYSNEQVNALSVSISFGWDTKRKTDEDILKVLKNAEDYMYKHKIIENQGMRGNTINTIISTLHEKNPREEQHSRRVSEICQNIGREIGFSEIEVGKLKVVGLLHDIGKIAIEEGILNKPGKLTEHERDEIKRHPDIGYRILSSSYDMLELANCILAHHERWDGAGYPKGLKGEAIPMVARIIALADSYDAMTSERPYRKALSEEVVIDEIRNNAGTQFDPEIARIFIEKVLRKRWD